MPEDLLPQTGDFKLYKERAVYAGTLLGGPLIGGYLIAENFKQLGEQEKARKTWLYAILATVAILAAALFIPGIERIPRFIIPLAYSLGAMNLVKHYQGAAIKAHVDSGGQTYSPIRVALIGLLGLAIMVGLVFGILLLSGQFEF